MDRNLLLHFSQAIYDVSKTDNKVEEYYNDLLYVDKVLKDNPDFVSFLSSPTIDYKVKEKAIEDVFSSISKSVYAFLLIVIKKHQIKHFTYIVSNYLNLLNIDKNILEGIIYTPFKLDDQTIEKLQDVFSKKYKKNIYLKERIDKKLIGGLKININDTLYDYSISSKIDNIKDKLTYKEE